VCAEEGREAQRPSVTVYTATGCSLCEPAKATVLAVAADVGADVEVVVIDGHPELERRHREHLPVVEIDGVAAYRLFVDEDDLERRLRRARERARRRPAPAEGAG
jgi:glutaredoxin